MHKKSALLLLAFGVLIGCQDKEAPPAEPESRPAKLLTVSVSNNGSSRKFPAVIEAGDKAILAFRVPGQLAKVNVHSGEVVERGQVLAQLNDDEYTLLQRQAQAQFQLANVQYERMSQLIKDRVISEVDFEQAKANYNSAKAFLEQATTNLNYTKLIAPYNGTISIVNVDNFEFVPADQAALNIQTTELLKVVFQIPDQLLYQFSGLRSETARVIFDSFPDKEFSALFQEIDTEADPKTASYKATFAMSRPENITILPGMAASIFLEFPASTATVIPDSAIMAKDGVLQVWRVSEDNATEKVTITVNNKGEIQQGLKDGDRIVASGVSDIVEGMIVREWIKERGL